MFEFFLNDSLYFAQTTTFASVHNYARNALLASTASTTRTVGVYLYIVREIVVDNVSQVADIQSTSCYVGGHQYLQIFDTEFVHHRVALRLTKVAV